MAKMIAYCGLDCSTCPGYIATKNDDNQARAKIAVEWSKAYNADIKPEYVNCDGCMSEDRLMSFCEDCGIRRCSMEKNPGKLRRMQLVPLRHAQLAFAKSV